MQPSLTPEFYQPVMSTIRFYKGQQIASQAFQKATTFRYSESYYKGRYIITHGCTSRFNLQWMQQIQTFTQQPDYQYHQAVFDIQNEYLFTRNPILPRMIEDIHFESLRHLSLTEAYLLNIEFLTFLDMETLSQLTLRKNNITNLKPLSKIKLNNLQDLELDQKKLTDYDIDRINFPKLMLTFNINCFVDRSPLFQKKKNRIRQVNDIRKIVKTRPQDIFFICCNSQYLNLHYPDIGLRLYERFEFLQLDGNLRE